MITSSSKAASDCPNHGRKPRCTPLSHSFCQHTVTSGKPLIVADAREHPLVRDNLAIGDLNVIAYAGVPLVTSDGFVLVCRALAIDAKPRA